MAGDKINKFPADSSGSDVSGSGGRGRGQQHPARRDLMHQQQGGGGRGRGRDIPQQGGRSGGYYQPHSSPQVRDSGSQPRGGGAPRNEYRGRSGPHPRGHGMAHQYAGGRWGGRSGPGQSAGPTSSPAPELPQATDAMSLAERQLHELSIQAEVKSPKQAIQALLSAFDIDMIRIPLDPGTGTCGGKCIVKANHFLAELPDKDVLRWDVTITPDPKSRAMKRRIIKELRDQQIHLGGQHPAYDGSKVLFTAGQLPDGSKDIDITIVDEKDGPGSQRRQRSFTVAIKPASHVDLQQLGQFLEGKKADIPQEAIQVLDIVLRELPTSRYTPIGRSFYSDVLGTPESLGDGVESWRGFYQSIRPTQMGLSLNIDMSSTVFIEPLAIIDFVSQHLNIDVSATPLSESDRVKIEKALKGVKVEVTHRGNLRRKYRISGLTSQITRELTFPVDDRGTVKNVVEYFQEAHTFDIKHVDLPCLQVGNTQRANYLPMEVCKIAKGQRYLKRLNKTQITKMLRATCQHPKDREQHISDTVRDDNDDPCATDFGIKIRKELTSVEARILPPPLLKYHDTGRVTQCLPKIGQWNMMDKKMVNGGRVENWAYINFARNVQDTVASGFCQALTQMCRDSGMEFSLKPLLHVSTEKFVVDKALKNLHNDAVNMGRKLDLLIAILPRDGSHYGDLKRICETDLGLVSQCCLANNVQKNGSQRLQYLANVALKINVKVGGRNTVLMDALSRHIPHVSDIPTIIFGADVTHPQPGEDSCPSIAAVVASQDWPEVTKYAALVCAQAHREEMIQDLYKVQQDPQSGEVPGGMIRELLRSFRAATGQKPERIIFYRDGVSEGQFKAVLAHELKEIWKACASLEDCYHPPVTFVVVQKRHHTRLFANNHGDRRYVDKSGNILPGTVVDSRICHPTQFDFYLCSHAGIQGTSRPAHYHVLWDDNKFTADSLQTLTNNLCYTYARCTRSVSIVPPVYYAHLAAYRARFYMEPETLVSESVANGARGDAVRPLPDLKENIKKVMFFC